MHSHFFWVDQTNTNVKRNLWSRMKTTILLYPQNHVEFSQQIGDKFHDFRRVFYIDGPLWHHEYTKSRAISKKVDNKFTSCTSFHLYLFKTKRRYFLISSHKTFFYVYLYYYEMKYHCKKCFIWTLRFKKGEKHGVRLMLS